MLQFIIRNIESCKKDNRTVPLSRAVAEAMDANVSWNEESKAVIITY